MAVSSSNVGAQVRALRNLTGLTREQLAMRTRVSVSMVEKVERGVRAASPSVTAALAVGLGVSVADLYGQPAPRFGTERSHVADVETAVIAGNALVDGSPAQSLAMLRAEVAEIAALHRLSRYHESSALIPDLLRRLQVAAASAPSGEPSERAYRLLAEAYSCVLTLLHRLGSPLTGSAAERAADAAFRSGDPLLAAVTTLERSLPLMHRGAYGPAQRLVDDAAASIADQPLTAGSASVRGYVHLRSAIISARRGDAPGADAHLVEARDLATLVPPRSDLYDTAFNDSNVRIHSVAAAVEMSDGTTALAREAASPPSPDTMTSRLGHHYVDLSRAHLLHGDLDGALRSLDAGRGTAPQLVRYHPQVKETVAELAGRTRRTSDRLRSYARWVAVEL